MGRDPLGVRPDLAGLEPYFSPQIPAEVRLNTNESPYPPPEELLTQATAEVASAALNRYPDRDAAPLTSALAAATGIPEECLWIANGSNEIFLHLFLAFGGPGRRALVFEPTYQLHSSIGRIAGTEIVTGERDEDFSVNAAALDDALEAHVPDIVMFCSPNNPTGALESREIVLRTLERAALVVVDEAYIEFAPEGSSMADLLDDHPNLAIVRTFSKAWSLAGVRLGYLMADERLPAEILRVRLPYHLSTFTQAAGRAAIALGEAAEQRVRALITERERLRRGLEDLGLRALESAANFVLFETGDTPAGELWDALRERGVLVRNYSSSPRLDGTLRVTAGLPRETDAFLDALREILEEV